MMKNKKDMVKQTKEMEDKNGKFSELKRIINALKKKDISLLFMTTRGEKTFRHRVMILKGMRGTVRSQRLYPEESEETLPQEFSITEAFKNLTEYIHERGGFEVFLEKIHNHPRKLLYLGIWEKLTGEHISCVLNFYIGKNQNDYETLFDTLGSTENEATEITLDIKTPYHQNNYYKIVSAGTWGESMPEYLMLLTFLEQYFKSEWDRPGTFAIPSDHKHWDPILLLFAGDPGIVRKKAFRKSPEDRTPEEQTEVDAYTENLFNTDAVGRIASVNILNAGTGNGNLDVFLKPHDQTELFNRDLSYQKGKAITEFYKTIGSPEGLRHYLAIFQGLDRAGRTGRFTFDMNKHLDRLGYKKQNGEKHRTRNKETALKIIQFLDNAVMDIQDPKDPTKNNRFRLLSSNIRYDNRKGISPLDRVETIKITMDDWYLDSFKDIPGKGPRYTKLLDQLLTEDHQRHGITLLVVPRLAILWRINGPEGPPNGLTVSWLLNVTAQGNHRKKESIKRLEGELEYMKQKNYIGEWTHDGNGKTIHESNNPESVHIFITGPDWSRKEMEIIKENRDQAVTLEIEPDPMTFEEFDRIFQALKDAGYSQENIARHTGLSRTALYNWKTRKRKISNGNAEKIREFYFSVTEKPDDDPETM